MDEIGLLLAYADSQKPVLEDGLAWEAAAKGPQPKKQDEDGPGDLRADGADPNDLHAQRWGLIVPDDDKLGDRMRSLIAPLVQERKQQQGAEPMIYKVPRNMGPEESARWWNEVYMSEEVDEAERPRYLLILGDADLVSWDLQQRLALDIFIGRLAFPNDDGYAAYANKLLAYERARPAEGARALFHTVRDGTPATTAGHAGLMLPTIAAAREGRKKDTFNAKEIVVLGEDSPEVSADDFCRAVAEHTPTMMFSISHGLGAPRAGWRSLEEQHHIQGAMSFGGGTRLTHEDVAKRPFLPGGTWFFFACLGAGTPSSSAYHHWLKELKDVGLFRGPLDDVLRSLPAAGQPPFVARLPQAALANPDGPISIVGHVDLAWTFSFQEYVIKDGKKVPRNRPSRFQDIFRELVEGKRMGAGYTALQRFFNNTNGDLTTLYDQEARARSRGLPLDEDPAKKMRKATLWMERQDLSAYVLLGDPAARLNVDPGRAQSDISAPIPSITSVLEMRQPASAPQAKAKKLDDPRKMEQAVIKILAEEAFPKQLAESLGVDAEDVRAWAEAYQGAGREALRKL